MAAFLIRKDTHKTSQMGSDITSAFRICVQMICQLT